MLEKGGSNYGEGSANTCSYSMSLTARLDDIMKDVENLVFLHLYTDLPLIPI